MSVTGHDYVPIFAGKLIAALDGSESSKHAARWAAQQAGRLDRDLHLVSIITPKEFSKETFRAIETELESLAADMRVADPGLKVAVKIYGSEPLKVLEQLASEGNQVVVGARGSGGPNPGVLGQVASRLVVDAPGLIWIVPEMPLETYTGPVVMSYGIGKTSDTAVELAFQVAQRTERELQIIHVTSKPEAAIRTQLETVIAPFKERYPRVSTSILVKSGGVSDVMVQVTKGAFALITGRTSRGRLFGIWAGSTTKQVLRFAQCPMAVVPDRGHAS